MEEQSRPQLAPNDQASEQAFEMLISAHRTAFERLSRRLARGTEDAEDLLQETLVDAYRAFRSFRTDSHFYSWVARIMTNNQLDRARRKQHPVVSLDHSGLDEASETLDLPDESSNPERLLLHGELDHRFQSALDALQPVHRATVLLCDLEGATYEEAARAADCPIGTIRSRLHRAHNSLREFLGRLELKPVPPAPARLHSRRAFLAMGTAAAAGAALQVGPEPAAAEAAEPLRLLLWGGGPAVRDALASVPGAEVHQPPKLRPDQALRRTDLLVWSSTSKRPAPAEDVVSEIVRRVRDQGMGLIVLGSADACPPMQALLAASCRWSDDRSGSTSNVSPLDLRITAPRHPIAAGVDAFRLDAAAPGGGKLDAPKPDVVVLDGTCPESGRTAWQGMVWSLGHGRLFYFQPLCEDSASFHLDEVRQVLHNAARWCSAPRAAH